MRQRIAAMTAAAAISVGAFAATAGTAGAASPAATGSQAESLEGARCVVAGVSFLRENGLLKAAALRQIDYSTLADPVDGPIFTTLPPGSNLSLGAVIRLHYTNPELFAWCG